MSGHPIETQMGKQFPANVLAGFYTITDQMQHNLLHSEESHFVGTTYCNVYTEFEMESDRVWLLYCLGFLLTNTKICWLRTEIGRRVGVDYALQWLKVLRFLGVLPP